MLLAEGLEDLRALYKLVHSALVPKNAHPMPPPPDDAA